MCTILFVLENAKTKINYSFFGKWHLETLPFFLALHIFTDLLSIFCFNVPDFYLEGVCQLLVYPFFSSRQFACHYLLWVISHPRVFNQWWERTSHFLKRPSHSVAILELVFCCCICFFFFHFAFSLTLIKVWSISELFSAQLQTPPTKKYSGAWQSLCRCVLLLLLEESASHTSPRSVLIPSR